MRYTDKIKPSEKARLGGKDPLSFSQVTAKQFMEDYTEQSRINFRGRIFCCFCSTNMSFVIRQGTPFFRHFKGTKSGICRQTSYISPDSIRDPNEIKKILQEENTFNIKGHSKKPKEGKTPSSVEDDSEVNSPLGDLQDNNNHPIKLKHRKVDKTDLSINEILTQVISGEDLSSKKFIFYGKSRNFDDIFINTHKISKDMASRLADGNIRIYWGNFNRICCKKNKKNCDLCDLNKPFIRKHPIFVYCGTPNKKEPIIYLKKECSSKIINTYRPLVKNKHPDGYLAVITPHFKWGNHPKITVHTFGDNICYVSTH